MLPHPRLMLYRPCLTGSTLLSTLYRPLPCTSSGTVGPCPKCIDYLSFTLILSPEHPFVVRKVVN